MQLQQPNVSHQAVVVAYEHHMHYNGLGGYPSSNRRPTKAAQLVAITDTYDALFGNRSYHDRFDIVEALEILNCDSGTVYSPDLVDHFTRFVNVNLDSLEGAAAYKVARPPTELAKHDHLLARSDHSQFFSSQPLQRVGIGTEKLEPPLQTFDFTL